jgi:hypothetical protein
LAKRLDFSVPTHKIILALISGSSCCCRSCAGASIPYLLIKTRAGLWYPAAVT